MCFSVFVFYWTEKGKKSGHNQNSNLQRPGFVLGLNVPWIPLCSSIIFVAGIKCLIKDSLWRMVFLGSEFQVPVYYRGEWAQEPETAGRLMSVGKSERNAHMCAPVCRQEREEWIHVCSWLACLCSAPSRYSHLPREWRRPQRAESSHNGQLS